MKIRYEQLTPEEALREYADWILSREVENPSFFKCLEGGEPRYEWYMIFYPLRTLMLAGKLLNNEKYIQKAYEYIDLYLTEQLPNGAFTSNYRQIPTCELSKKDFEHILRFGKCNLADVGSNVVGIIQAAALLAGEKRDTYVSAVRKWLDNWVAIWALPNGGYGNGIWCGNKINSPYTCSISNVCSAFSIFGILTGEYEYVEKAETAMEFQCSKWQPDGLPVFMDCYPLPREFVLVDYGHIFYLLEGMCWTHRASKNKRLKELLEKRMTEWIFSKECYGVLNQWKDSWFNFMIPVSLPAPETMPNSRLMGLRMGWEMAKSNGIIHCFQYYLNHINDNPELRKKVELGLEYLSHPLKARMSGVMSDPEESYGAFAVQSTGFAGLSIAEALKKDVVFDLG